MSSNELKIEKKFIGRFREGIDDEKERPKHRFYTVHRWISDTENRIASKKITVDQVKIKEACLAVHPDVGDAASVIHSDMLDVDKWEEFKARL